MIISAVLAAVGLVLERFMFRLFNDFDKIIMVGVAIMTTSDGGNHSFRHKDSGH